jgi:hypothetical protein
MPVLPDDVFLSEDENQQEETSLQTILNKEYLCMKQIFTHVDFITGSV